MNSTSVATGSNPSFVIGNHLDRLTPTGRKKNQYHCPVCQGNNFEIALDGVKYSCFNGCKPADIREAVAPLPQKKSRPQQRREWVYFNADGVQVVKTCRIDDGTGKKIIWQQYYYDGQWQKQAPDGEAGKQLKRSLMPYQWHQVKDEPTIFWVEGEPIVDTLLSLGIPATTSIGGTRSLKNYGDYASLVVGKKLVLCPDMDAPGVSYMEQVASMAEDVQWCYAFPSDPRWKNLPSSSGLDLADWIEAGATKDQILESVQKEPIKPKPQAKSAAKGRSTGSKAVESWADGEELEEGEEISEPVEVRLDPDEEFTQKVVRKLYSDIPWICVAGELYQWTGTYYRRSPDEVELKRIQKLADSCCYFNERLKRLVYPYAKPSAVKAALEWAKILFAVLPEQCNPPGLNCTNGVLVRKGESNFELLPHSPDRYFLYEPMAKFDPDAPVEDCDRLLSALDEGQQQVLLRTVAAALDISMVRRRHGRLVRAILAKGVGNNGKDAHREVVSLLWGRTGMASCAFEDFQQYDDGRKFPIIGLMNARVNWASENKKSVNLDSLQSLKRTITGDTLHYERKGKDTQEFMPQCVSIFNVNDIPNLKAGLEAIKSRFAVVSYNRVYKKDADSSRGEIEVDPRFKYDPDFMRENVLPAFLNKVIQAFKDLMDEGIDYSCCDKALEEVQIHNSHLFEFALETGLTFDPDSEIPVDDLWKRLEAWYKDTGVLTIEYDGMKERRIWADPIRPGDLYIKGANQIVQRFTNLYPQAKKISLGKNRQAIKGLKFADPKSLVPAVEDASPPEPQPAEAAEAKAVQPEQISSSEDNPALIARYTTAFKQAVQMTGASQLDTDQCLIQLLEEMKPLALEVHQGVWDELSKDLRKHIQFKVLKKRPDLARSK